MISLAPSPPPPLVSFLSNHLVWPRGELSVAEWWDDDGGTNPAFTTAKMLTEFVDSMVRGGQGEHHQGGEQSSLTRGECCHSNCSHACPLSSALPLPPPSSFPSPPGMIPDFHSRPPA